MILLTGASGFIGKHLLSALINQYGADNIVALTSKPINQCQYLLHKNYAFDSDYIVRSGFGNIHTIIHAGAFIPKSNDEANDREKANSNICNTNKLLSAVLPQLKKIIYLSTVDVYAPAAIISEASALAPISLYGASKFYGEEMIKAWSVEKNAQYQILRIGHVYGPGEEAYQKIIPVTINKLLNKRPVQIWGSGNEIRSFIFIDDVVTAIINSLKLKINGVINLVSNQQVTIKKLVEELAFISGQSVQIENIPVQYEGRNLIFDNTKMNAQLLTGETALAEGLAKEWAYMKGLSE